MQGVRNEQEGILPENSLHLKVEDWECPFGDTEEGVCLHLVVEKRLSTFKGWWWLLRREKLKVNKEIFKEKPASGFRGEEQDPSQREASENMVQDSDWLLCEAKLRTWDDGFTGNQHSFTELQNFHPCSITILVLQAFRDRPGFAYPYSRRVNSVCYSKNMCKSKFDAKFLCYN